jgi:cytochrome c biogenesis protein CcmG/thiol:disulfide interchange protein DsbE
MDVLDGKEFRLRDYRGRAVILNIFATWCPPCKFEQSFLVDAAARYAAQGLAIVGINAAEADDTVRAYRKKYGIEFPIAMDRTGGFGRALEVGTNLTADELLPTSLFFTPAGYLYCEVQGAMNREELDHRIRTFLVNAPPTVIPSASPSPSPSPLA